MKYNKKFAKELLDGLRADGKSEVECCLEWGISLETYNQWVLDVAEFATAATFGKMQAAAWCHKKYREIAAGKSPGNAAMMQFAMKNQEYIRWQDKPEAEEVKDEPVGVIQIEVLPQRGLNEQVDKDSSN